MSELSVLEHALRWLAEGRSVALATVVRTWGSSPRPVGSLLAVDERGAMEGSVSGGCVESAVVQSALELLRGGPSRLLSFKVSDERAWSVGLTCGGALEVALARADAAVVARAAQALGERGEADFPLEVEGAPPTVLLRAAPRLVVVGAVHIAQALAPMALAAGLPVTIVDPRPAFATEARFPLPGVRLERTWPEEALGAIGLDRRTAVVTLSHDPKLDEPALLAALRSSAFYVGALGSRKTQARLRARLAAQGLPDAALARIHGPVGLSIGAVTPGEIAVSILAEVVACARAALSGDRGD